MILDFGLCDCWVLTAGCCHPSLIHARGKGPWLLPLFTVYCAKHFYESSPLVLPIVA